MLSIQVVGSEILSEKPRKLYIMLGDEWGIKQKYIDLLTVHYAGNIVEYPTIGDFLQFVKTKRLIPAPPSVYVIRQDETFVSSLAESSASLMTAKIPGTLVCVYDGDKYLSKFDKTLPENTVVVSKVSKPFLTKYLHSDFPNLADDYINLAVDISDDYGAAKNVCRALAAVPVNRLAKLDKNQLSTVFGYTKQYTDQQVRLGVAAKDFRYLSNAIQSFITDLDTVLYSILSTMLELEKLKCNSRAQSDLTEYAKYWSIPDIYYMFDYTYEEIRKLRSMSSYSPENSILFLFSLLTFQNIPAPEVLR